jgi:hypothetical protein
MFSQIFKLFIHSSMYLQPSLSPGRFFSFVILYTVGRIPWTRDQPDARPLPIHRTARTQNKRTQKSMPRVVSEPTIPAFERAKTIHDSDRAATVVGIKTFSDNYYNGMSIEIIIFNFEECKISLWGKLHSCFQHD